MSTDYATLKKVHIADLLDGRLEEFGIREHISIWTNATSICLTDGQSCLWVELYESGFVMMITRYGENDPDKILRAIAEVFDTEIVSEHEPQFWGFDTQEQWDEARKEIGKEYQNRFYLDIEDCALLQPEQREEFLNKINEIYRRDKTQR